MAEGSSEKVIVAQPQAGAFVLPANMKYSETNGCPPGLEYLTQIDQVVIKQQIELCEVLTGCEMKNKYRIYNNVGQQIYYAEESTGCCMRVCCGPLRGFQIHVVDNNNVEVMRIIRDFKCCAGCCWCANGDHCGLEVRVESPPGTIVGYARQKQSCWKPIFGILDALHEQISTVRGPCCVCNCPCCGDVEFPILTLADTKEEEQLIAMFSKQWSGVLVEFVTDADTFNISFPLEMDPKIKASLFGLMMLVDMMYFEKNN